MASVLLYHVVGDLTLGKPELVEFCDTETVESAAREITGCSEGAITVWKRKGYPQQQAVKEESSSSRAGRFVGMLNTLDLVAFLAKVGDQERAMKAPVSEVVVPNAGLLKEVDPATRRWFSSSRLIDALEMMKQGARRLLVRKSTQWKGMSKRFSVIYNGRWLKSLETPMETTSSRPSSSFSKSSKFCCLSREDVIRFLICCLGALNPIPLSSISVLGIINPHYTLIEVISPAMEAVQKPALDPCAIAVVETNPNCSHRIIGEISAYKLWKCDYWAAAWALANVSAGQFVMGSGDDNSSPSSHLTEDSANEPSNWTEGAGDPISLRPRKFSSRNIGFFSKQTNLMTSGRMRRSMYRGRSAPLTCKNTSSLAAVMAQMLSHRATHVWVTDADSDDVLVGIVGYTDILNAVTRNPSTVPAGAL